MSDYSDLIKRLRGKKLNCTCAAKSVSECCCDTDWPESSCNEAADAIEALEKRIAVLSAPPCIGETTIRLLAKEGACEWEDGRAVVAADDLFRQDPYIRIAKLETALKRFADQSCLSDELPKTDSVFVYVSDLRQARKVLGEKE